MDEPEAQLLSYSNCVIDYFSRKGACCDVGVNFAKTRVLEPEIAERAD